MDTDGLVATLEEAGLSPYQSAAYVALLELGAASATAVAEASEVPKPRIYDVLGALESRGYVETYETDSLRARAHSPASVLDDLRDRATRFEAAATEVEDRWEQPELESNRASVVRRFQTVVERAEAFIEDADYLVQVSVTAAGFERLQPRLAAAHDRGVSVRVSLHTDESEHPPDAVHFSGKCLEVRHRPFPAPFVVLVDREKTCFAHHPDTADEYGVLVNDRTHTYVFHWYFLTCLWEGWEPLYAANVEEFPVEYVDIRQCVRDIAPLVEAGATITARIEGHDVETGRERRLAGDIEEVVVANTPSGGVLEAFAGQVSLVVRTAEGVVNVGGWGAMVEDVEARRITVESATGPDGTGGLKPARRGVY
jgi:sugar-specific transcriptional regulator TrmB